MQEIRALSEYTAEERKYLEALDSTTYFRVRAKKTPENAPEWWVLPHPYTKGSAPQAPKTLGLKHPINHEHFKDLNKKYDSLAIYQTFKGKVYHVPKIDSKGSKHKREYTRLYLPNGAVQYSDNFLVLYCMNGAVGTRNRSMANLVLSDTLENAFYDFRSNKYVFLTKDKKVHIYPRTLTKPVVIDLSSLPQQTFVRNGMVLLNIKDANSEQKLLSYDPENNNKPDTIKIPSGVKVTAFNEGKAVLLRKDPTSGEYAFNVLDTRSGTEVSAGLSGIKAIEKISYNANTNEVLTIENHILKKYSLFSNGVKEQTLPEKVSKFSVLDVQFVNSKGGFAVFESQTNSLKLYDQNYNMVSRENPYNFAGFVPGSVDFYLTGYKGNKEENHNNLTAHQIAYNKTAYYTLDLYKEGLLAKTYYGKPYTPGRSEVKNYRRNARHRLDTLNEVWKNAQLSRGEANMKIDSLRGEIQEFTGEKLRLKRLEGERLAATLRTRIYRTKQLIKQFSKGPYYSASQMQSMKAQALKVQTNLSDKELTYRFTRRSFLVNNFGMCNIDRLMSEGEEIPMASLEIIGKARKSEIWACGTKEFRSAYKISTFAGEVITDDKGIRYERPRLFNHLNIAILTAEGIYIIKREDLMQGKNTFDLSEMKIYKSFQEINTQLTAEKPA